MEIQLVISTVSKIYGHLFSLAIRASLFIFITTSLHRFSLSYYAFVFVIHLLCSVMVIHSFGADKQAWPPSIDLDWS